MKTLLNEDIVKQIFFYSDEKRKDALLANEVDICQFADKLERWLQVAIARQEHQRCVELVSSLNREVGRVLAEKPPA
jgi:hypothetical protein